MNMRVLPAFIFFLLMSAFSLPALAENIYLSHTFVGFTEGADTATLDLTLHVENLGVTDCNNLNLSYVPLRIIAVEEVAVNLTTIGAGQTMDISITMITPLPIDQSMLEQEPLFWAGEYDDPEVSGAIVEFPAESHNNGGAL